MSNPATETPVDKDEERKEIQRKILASRQNLKKTFDRYNLTFQMAGFLFIFSGVVICFYKIPAFREYANSIGVFTVPLTSLYWCAVGFAFNYFGRKGFFALTSEFFRKRLHPKVEFYNEEDQQEKLFSIVKQTYEGFFHLAATVLNWWLFHEEVWFPSWIGGKGDCDSTFATYPQWPEPNGYYLLAFYQFQLGTYAFHILELLVFEHERYKTKNFGELFYHHFVAILLIAFSLFYNFVPIGITVLFVHDSSDFIRGFSRTVGDSWASILYPRFALGVNITYLASFVYMRLAVLPFCLIESMHANNPSVQKWEEWGFLWWQCAYFIVISCAIYCIQCYWAYFVYYKIKEEHDKNKWFVTKHEKEQKALKDGKGEGKEGGKAEKKLN